MAADRTDLRVSVDCGKLNSFAVERFGSLKAMAAETGVSERTIHRAKENGFISLESALSVCLAAGEPLEDVFGRQQNTLKNIAWMLPTGEPTFVF